MHFVPSEGRTQCLLRQVIQIYGTITPLHINNQITTQHRVHTSKILPRNTEGWVIYIYSRTELNTETDSERYGGIIANVASELFRFSDCKSDTLNEISDTLNFGIE